ncbi:hypothetical protein MFM001_32110 [Mycobacterium sp. MFM001]|nr:hypothetical protein MFM001_32110 [Mycobacterium sp. MFM001]
MRSGRYAAAVTVSFVSAGVMAAGCTTIAGTPVAETDSAPITSLATTTLTPAAPTGKPVGTAVMKVSGGSAPVTIRYRINAGPEQTETNVALPWEKQYTVYNEVESEVTADGGDTDLTCSIIMDGDKLASFKSEPRPTCSFAYYG